MYAGSAKLRRLRAVTFHLQSDPSRQLQYGLSAEEVAKVYPELVIRDGSGKPEGVRDEELSPILLSKVQDGQRTIAAQRWELQQQERSIRAQENQLRELSRKPAELSNRLGSNGSRQ
ncbi:MAG TPA: tail fiber domain-containing protein [Steroidobacteraceae bacterium]|nr:tail fiber domain-containing protein [Steroidobacteraceae bacterium]